MAKLHGITPAVYAHFMAKMGAIPINEYLSQILDAKPTVVEKIVEKPSPFQGQVPLVEENAELKRKLIEAANKIGKLEKKIRKLSEE